MVIATCALATLTGCAASANVPPAGAKFDGEYAGESTLTSGFGYVCRAPSYPVSVSIKDGRFAYTVPINPWTFPVVPVQIRADGTLAGQTQYWAETFAVFGPDIKPAWVTITGHTAGPVLDATVRDDRCVRHMVLQRH